MTTYQFVTTFSPEGYHCYGQRFLDSFVQHSQSHKLTIYHESQGNIDFHKLITWKNLDHDEDRRKFIEDHGQDPKKVGSAADPNSQAIRFCHKVFAVTDAIKNHEADWVIWIDADVVITNEVSSTQLEVACPDGKDLSYLARVDAPYTECGFVGYRAASNQVQRLGEDMRRYYTTGEIFTRPKSDWHDSRCFDVCRGRNGIGTWRLRNLSQQLRGMHVWPQTCLASWSTHQKGPKRKKAAYGHYVR